VTLVVPWTEVKEYPGSIAIVINLKILILSDKLALYRTTATIELLEVVLGGCPVAMTIQLMLNGLAELVAITLTGHALLTKRNQAI
jgi:hypothetical protein